MNDNYTIRHRGKKGNKSIVTNARNGAAVAVRKVNKMSHKLIILSASGQVAKFPVSELRLLKPNSQGVRVMDLDDGDMVVDAIVA
ncbi:hypothetical protein KAR91_62610 [Candidatus Pacearchaeota archaeon]|nr:hypothetical protein [Candidatus Pacearchaeota archaeon]